jgi:hypothetical protein
LLALWAGKGLSDNAQYLHFIVATIAAIRKWISLRFVLLSAKHFRYTYRHCIDLGRVRDPEK